MSPRTSRAYSFLLLIFFARKSFLYRILAVSRLFRDIYTHAVQTAINKRLVRKILPGGGGYPSRLALYPCTEIPENVTTTRPRIGTPNALAGSNTLPRS